MMTLYPIFIILWYGKQLTAWIKDDEYLLQVNVIFLPKWVDFQSMVAHTICYCLAALSCAKEVVCSRNLTPE